MIINNSSNSCFIFSSFINVNNSWNLFINSVLDLKYKNFILLISRLTILTRHNESRYFYSYSIIQFTIYIYISLHIDIYFLLESTDNPNSLLSKIFLFDSPSTVKRLEDILFFHRCCIVLVGDTTPSILPPWIFWEGGRFLNKRGTLPSLNPPRYHYPREILAAEYIFLVPFSKPNSEYSNRLHSRALFTHPTRDRYPPREDIKAVPCLASKGARISKGRG